MDEQKLRQLFKNRSNCYADADDVVQAMDEDCFVETVKEFLRTHNVIKIWDNHNQQWLEPMAIFFDKDNTVWKVTACKIGEDPLSDGWYDLQGDDLKKIAIVGDFNWNVDLLPPVGQNEQLIQSCSVCGTTKHPIIGAHCKVSNCPHEH